jgi:acyl dehydratase
VRFESPSALTVAAGVDLGSARTILVDQERISAFASVTEDRQWIHTDAERAAAGPYGTTIAHGYLTLSLVSYFLEDLFQVDQADVRVNYGLDKVRFLTPVKAGTSLTGGGRVLSADHRPDGSVRATLEIEIREAPDGSIVCVAQPVVLLYTAS